MIRHCKAAPSSTTLSLCLSITRSRAAKYLLFEKQGSRGTDRHLSELWHVKRGNMELCISVCTVAKFLRCIVKWQEGKCLLWGSKGSLLSKSGGVLSKNSSFLGGITDSKTEVWTFKTKRAKQNEMLRQFYLWLKLHFFLFSPITMSSSPYKSCNFLLL